MAIRNLGQALANLVKPDGSPISDSPTRSILNLGTVATITGLTPSRATDRLINDKSSAIANPLGQVPRGTKNLPSLFPNPLEEFASYTCLWTLACLTPNQFNNPRSYRDNPSSLKNIVFASGGRYDSRRAKTFFGTPEYFINNFQMNCIIGTNEKTGNSNAIKFSFDIYEPHSMGLLLQSLQTAAIDAGYINYLQNAPYVLRMDIQGYNELGQVIKSVKPKFFTLKLVSVKFSVNEGGSTYKVEAIPYNHQGFSDVINTVYNDIKIFGADKGTVEEVLVTGPESLVAVLNRNEETLLKEGKIGQKDVYDIQFPNLASEWVSSAGNPPSNNRATRNPNIEDAISIAKGVNVPASQGNRIINNIGGATFGFSQTSGGNAIFKRAGDQIDSKTGVVRRNGMTIDPKIRAFQFGQGQTLTAIINQIILSSDYAKKAITDKTEGGFGTTEEGYFKWFKLDVQIELLQPDPITGDYAKKITYRVVPYYIHQSIFSNPNSMPIGYEALMKKVVKEYNYIYTGQNTDVLKFDININNLFFAGVAPKPENQGAQTRNQDQKASEKLNKTTETGRGEAPGAQAATGGRHRPNRDPRLLEGYKGGSGEKTTEQNVAENFQRAFLSGNSADLVTVDLEILGDPYWIVDSGIANYFAPVAEDTSQVTADGTMNYESGNIYIYLTFRTPADINETTGLYDFSVAGKESPFGGIYRVNLCENIYQDGVWKQKLKLLRMPGPQGPELTTKTGVTVPLPKSKENNSATDISKQESPSTSPVQNVNKPAGKLASAGVTNPVQSSTSASGAPLTLTPPPSPSAPATPRYILQRESIKLQEAFVAKLDVWRANKTDENFAAYKEAKAISDRFIEQNNL